MDTDVTAASLNWKDYTAAVGIALSFGYNVFNHVQARRAKILSEELAEFRLLRVAVESALQKLSETQNSLNSMIAFGGTDEEFRAQIHEINRVFPLHYNSLLLVLKNMDNSRFSAKKNREEAASDLQDTAMGAIQRLYADHSIIRRSELCGQAAKQVQDIIDDIRGSIEAELNLKIRGKTWTERLKNCLLRK